MASANLVLAGDEVRRKEAMENLVGEIVRGENDILVPSLRSAIERGMGYKFIDTLSEAKKKRENEIDKICSRHYTDFLASVQELLQIRGSADTISKAIAKIHDDFENANIELTSLLKKLDSLQNERENTKRAVEDIQKCRELADLIVQTKKYISSEDYFSALNTIENLKRELSGQNWKPLGNTLLKWLPGLIDQLLGAAKISVQSCLVDIQSKTQTLGTTIQRKYAISVINTAYSNEESSFPVTLSLLSIDKTCQCQAWHQEDYLKQADKTIPQDYKEKIPPIGAQLFEDITELLAPLHKALHMHAQLGMISVMHELYRTGREVIIKQRLITPDFEKFIAISGIVEALPQVLSTVVGFFALECIIQKSVDYPEGIFSLSQLRELWIETCEIVSGTILKYVGTVKSVDVVLKIKEQLLLAQETLDDDAFGMKDRSLLDVTNKLWDTLVDLQAEAVSAACIQVLNGDAYQSLYVSTESQYKELVLDYFLENVVTYLDNNSELVSQKTAFNINASLDALEEEQMKILDQLDEESDEEGVHSFNEYDVGKKNFVAVALPFSAAVPTMLHHIQMIIMRFLHFAIRNKALSPKGNSLCAAIEDYFDIVVGTITDELVKDGPDTPLSKACQISIDATTFSYTCVNLKEFLVNILAQLNWIDAIDSTLDSTISTIKRKFDSLAIKAQDLMFELLTTKVVDLLASLTFVNWSPSTLPPGPHECIEELIDYLRATFMWLNNVPRTVREAAHFSCCSKANATIIEFLLSPKVPKINMLSVLALELDVRALDSFADSCGIMQLKECFTEFRNLVKAMLHRDLPHLGEASFRNNLFPHLDLGKLALLVDKIKPLPPGVMAPSVIQYDKKSLASIVKSLKQGSAY